MGILKGLLALAAIAVCARASEVFIPCDLDLPNIREILPFLPIKCGKIYIEQIVFPKVLAAYVDEARKFNAFYQKLDKYEFRGSGRYVFETDLRKRIYTKVDWATCVATANDTGLHYVDCLQEKYVELKALVPRMAGDDEDDQEGK